MATKGITQSYTFWGGLLVAVTQYLEAQGVLQQGVGAQLTDAGASLGTLIALLGIRKAIKPDVNLPGSANAQ